MMLRPLAALTVLTFFVNSTAVAASFEADVAPIFAKKCAGCHSPAAGKVKGKLNLESAETALQGGESGAAILPGKAQESLLVGAIEHRVEPHMPPPGKFDKLSDAEIALIRQWIDEGAKFTASPSPTPAPAEDTSSSSAQSAAAPVTSLAYSPQGDLLARGGMHTVTLWRVADDAVAGGEVAVLDGHAEAVRALAFSPDGALLAAAGGKPGRAGEVIIWRVADRTKTQTLAGHRDNVLGVAFSPDGTRMVTCSYDKTAKIWEVASGKELLTLSDHVDAINSVAFSPDGKTIATGSSDRTVKLWDAATGERQITLSDSTDAVLTLAISPDGKYLAAGAADKRIRIWDLVESGNNFKQTGLTSGVLKQSTFAHEGPVIQLAYAADGATLYSVGEDRRVKAWDTSTVAEKVTFETQPESILAMALRADGKRVAVGRYDAGCAVLDTENGKTLLTSNGDGPLAKVEAVADSTTKKARDVNVDLIVVTATIPPTLQSIAPMRQARGTEFEATVMGTNLEGAEPYFDDPKLSATLLSSEALPVPEVKRDPNSLGAQIFDNAVPYRLKVKVNVPADTAPGPRTLLCKTPLGVAEGTQFVVLSSADLGETEPNNDIAEAQTLQWPSAVSGVMNSENDRDRFKVHLATGKEIVCVLKDAATGFLLTVRGADEKELASSERFGVGDAVQVGFRAETEGDYFIEVSHKDFRRDVGYRLHVGEFPWVYEVSPLGVQAGPAQTVAVNGFNIGGAREMGVDPPDSVVPWHIMDLPLPAYENNPATSVQLAVASYPAIREVEPNNIPGKAQPVTTHQTVDAVLDETGDEPQDLYRVSLKAGESVLIDVNASRLGSPLDAVVDVLDASGKRLKRAQARCVGQTFTTLTDRDSFSAGIRIDNWSDMAINDYLMIGNEIMQVFRLPGYADEDITLRNYRGKRMGFFGTSPEYHAVNSPVYKIELRGPDEELPSNGMPVFPIYWSNDDAVFDNERRGDSQLAFVAPADGDYLLRVRDAAGGTGPRYQYRLMLRQPEPTFDFFIGPYRINVTRGGSVPVDVALRRRDGFEQPVTVRFEGLPPGLTISETILTGDDESAQVALEASAEAQSTGRDARFRAVATAMVDGVAVTRESWIGDITVVDRVPDLRVNVDAQELVIRPGEVKTIQVSLERNNGFGTRVPIDVLNLPFGVRVIDTGLNGILVRDGEFTREVRIYCEPWMQPMTAELFVQARIEARAPGRMLFLGPPVALRVLPQDQAVAAR